MQLEQLEPVARLGPQQLVHDERRARVDAQGARRVEAGDQVEVVVDGRCHGLGGRQIGRPQCCHELDHAILGLAPGLGVVAVEPVQPGTGMGVDQCQPGLFLHQMAQRGDQGGVLEHVGVVAGVEGVSVTEHGSMVAPPGSPDTRRLSATCQSVPIFRTIESFAAKRKAPRRRPHTGQPGCKTPPKSVPTENNRPWKRAAKPSFKEKTHDYYVQRQTS
ncbi:hypothetical protein FQZ97_966000 [compost metagenome]